MDVWVKGVKIRLVPEQLAVVNKELRARERCRNSFDKMLRRFGFKHYPGLKDCYQHPYFNWWAEIQCYGRYSEVFMAGEGLKHSSCIPGGWNYSEPSEIEEVLSKLIDELSNEK